MSGFTQIGVGSSANDGTGDALRTAMQAVNSNYGRTTRALDSVTDLASEAAAAGYTRIVNDLDRGGVFKAVNSGTVNNGTIFASATAGWTWQRIYSGHVNIDWFGAVGDGETDNTSIFNSIKSFGFKHIRIPKKEYAFNTNALSELNNFSEIVGDCKNLSILKSSKSSNDTGESRVFLELGENCSLKNITIKDASENPLEDRMSVWAGVQVKSGCDLENVIVSGFTKAITCQSNSNNWNLINVEAKNSYTFGVEVFNSSKFLIQGSESHNNGTDGFKINSSDVYYNEWKPAAKIPANVNWAYENNVYTATAGGTTGFIPPTHESGSETDGGITWEFLSSGYDKINYSDWIMANSKSYNNGKRDINAGGSEAINGNGMDLYSGGVNGAVIGCIFESNYGAGVVTKSTLADNIQGKMLFIGCKFNNNLSKSDGLGGNIESHGAFIQGENDSKTVFSSCFFENNSGRGISVPIKAKAITIIGSVFSGNISDGIRIGDGSMVLISCNQFIANGLNTGSGNLSIGTSFSTPPADNLTRGFFVKDNFFVTKFIEYQNVSNVANIVGIDVSSFNISVQEAATGTIIEGNVLYGGGVAETEWQSIRMDCQEGIIRNNVFIGGYSSIQMAGSSAKDLTCLIENNLFDKVSGPCIRLVGQDNIAQIFRNTFKSPSSSLLSITFTVSDTSAISVKDIIYWASGSEWGIVNQVVDSNNILVYVYNGTDPSNGTTINNYSTGDSFVLTGVSSANIVYNTIITTAETGCKIILLDNKFGGGESSISYLYDVVQRDTNSVKNLTTTLNSNASSGDYTISLASVSGVSGGISSGSADVFSRGETFSVMTSDGIWQSEIQSVNSGASTITLVSAIPQNLSSGDLVTIKGSGSLYF